MPLKHLLRYLLLLSLPLLILDQWSKWRTLESFSPPPEAIVHPETQQLIEFNGTLDPPVQVIDGFLQFTRVHNTGVSFGMFADSPAANWIFGALSVTILIGLLIYWKSGKLGNHPVTSVAAALLVSGIIGNLTDRIRVGYVIDFISVYLDHDSGPQAGEKYFNFAVFNVADSCVCIAAGLIILSSFLDTEARQPNKS